MPYPKVALQKIPETEAILAQLAPVNAPAEADESVLRWSVEAQARVWVGDYWRGGPSRITVKAADPDCQPEAQLTRFGIRWPPSGAVWLDFTTSQLSRDFRVDCRIDCWARLRERFPQVTTLGLNLDNGPENHSRRTQFMQPITECVDHFHVSVDRADDPPDHSQYNPVEPVWGGLEKHWKGRLLVSGQTVLQFAPTMTFRGRLPLVQGLKTVDHTGVRLTPKQMAQLQPRFERLPGLAKWFVRIVPMLG